MWLKRTTEANAKTLNAPEEVKNSSDGSSSIQVRPNWTGKLSPSSTSKPISKMAEKPSFVWHRSGTFMARMISRVLICKFHPFFFLISLFTTFRAGGTRMIKGLDFYGALAIKNSLRRSAGGTLAARVARISPLKVRTKRKQELAYIHHASKMLPFVPIRLD